jgi:hypothetical protein
MRTLRRELPWTYWPIIFAWFSLCGIVGVAIFVTFHWNPYIGFLAAYGVALLREVYTLRSTPVRGGDKDD